MVNSPLFSIFAGLVSILITCSWGICSSKVSSIVMILSLGLMKAERAFKVVVLPELVPPDIIAFADFTPSPSMHSQKNAANSIDIVFEFIRSIIVNGSRLNFLIVSEGPSADTGGIVAFILDPSTRRPSSIGDSWSILLLICLAMMSIKSLISCSSLNWMFVFIIPYFLW